MNNRKFYPALQRIIILLLSAGAITTPAQRHGRADSVQNYSPKPPNPILNLHSKITEHWIYQRPSDLQRMHRTTISVVAEHTHQVSLYEGVALSDLFARAPSSYRVYIRRCCFTDKLAAIIPSNASYDQMLIADTVNGKKLHGKNPFLFVALRPDKTTSVVGNLAFVVQEPEK